MSGTLGWLGLAAPAWAQQATRVMDDITVRGMFAQADRVVQTVMLVLVLASVATLSIGLYKLWEMLARRRGIAAALGLLADAPALAAARELPDTAVQAMVQAAREEAERIAPRWRHRHAEAIKERGAALIQRIGAGRQRQLSRGVSVLGSIGAAAPFIGLFGTVWGIMNSFIGIARVHTTNLAVVAPGIAEALLATAFGLVAAIPAVLVYNAVVRAIAGYRVKLDDAATQVMCLLSRDLDGGEGDQQDASGKPKEVAHGV